ncbi:MAG: carbohydrate binding domain-containing protein [Rikenellaceae bacterium]|nr:carbohydrate binding domain-containing protein [Rikenellaceae bacterium]
MKNFLWYVLIVISVPIPAKAVTVPYNSNKPDSAYIFSYASENNKGKNGLHFAWSTDEKYWFPIGPEHSYIKSDYGNWGDQKRMLEPFLFQDEDGMWHCLWTLNERDGVLAHAASRDLIVWGRQSYPEVILSGSCRNITVEYDRNSKKYNIYFSSESDGGHEYYVVETSDFKNYSEAEKTDRRNSRDIVLISGKKENGIITKVPWCVIDAIIKGEQLAAYRSLQNAETAESFAAKYSDLKEISAKIIVDPNDTKEISDMLIGIFFEDISYAADGGLYAELIQNRGFEYTVADKKGRDQSWNSKKAWRFTGREEDFIIDTVSPVHINNIHYAVLNIREQGPALINEGFSGIPLVKGEKYDFSVFAKSPDGGKGRIIVRLTGNDGKIYAQTEIKSIGKDWKNYQAVLTANETIPDAQLEIIPQTIGKTALDMVSLFPQKTFKNRKNGLRKDLAEVIADLNPRFVRFLGGCVTHGDGLDNIYRWKNTVGPLESRVPQRNIWNYNQSYGLGFYEYFLFCEDIGAEPVPVLAAGVPCQNSSTGGAGQQGGIPMCDMDAYIQEILDLIEYANGDKNTVWGKVRAEAGHPEPFNLKYLGIGNEDLITDIFEERFEMIFNAVKEKYPDIVVIGTAGPFSEGADYEEGWDIARRLSIPVMDEHYYQSPGWFVNNQDFYDKYDRSGAKVYLGEYAAHLPSRHNNIETALTEALFLTSLERNGDIVYMTSYAPLLAKEGFTNWNPDLIYFNNTEVKPTVGYYTQQMYGQNGGRKYITSSVQLSNTIPDVSKRFGVSVVKNTENNELIIKIINLLHVPVSVQLPLEGYSFSNNDVIKTVLSGRPADRRAEPVQTTGPILDTRSMEIPAYSFTVLKYRL